MGHVTHFLNIFYAPPTKVLWPVYWIPQASWFSFALLILFTFIILNLLIIFRKPTHSLRILSFVSFFLMLAAYFSYGKIDHVYHHWLLLLFVLSIPKTLDEKWNHRLAVIFTLTYFSSGIWKIRGLAAFLQSYPELHLADYLRIQINAISIDNGPSVFADLLNSPTANILLIFGIIFTIFVQCAPLIFVTFRKYSLALTCILLMHLSTLIFLGLWFHTSMLLGIVLLTRLGLSSDERPIKGR